MKVSLNLAQHYSNVDFSECTRDELVTKAGEQLGGIDEVIDWAPKYDKAVVVRVVSCEDHQDSDHLHVCKVDDGGKTENVERDDAGHVQVVCGALNVRVGMLAAWLPPSATVPSSYGTAEPFVLDARVLRGVNSNGMLASAKELAIDDEHEGILEIDPEEVGRMPEPGEPLVEYFGLDDYVMDFENKMFTHRPDCFGVLGVARELAGITNQAFHSPEWYTRKPRFKSTPNAKLTIINQSEKLVPRFMAVEMHNVVIGKSPVWLRSTLTRLGMKPINNIVDVTNFVMYLTGQPLHAYDADKLGTTLIARMGRLGEKLALLNGKTIEVTEQDIVIATDKKPVGLAGIMGGSETEVDDTTKNIIIECATFDMYTIRRSSMHHGLFTDASTRYTKGQSSAQNDRALWLCMEIMHQLSDAVQYSPVLDVKTAEHVQQEVTVSADFINSRLGSDLSVAAITKLLENVEFTINPATGGTGALVVRAPFWRTDIELPEDIVEEVGRLHGYAGLPVMLPSRTSKPTRRNAELDFKQSLRNRLTAAGANEVLTYSFVHGDLLRKTGSDPYATAYHIRNAISPDLQYYRTDLMPSLLDKVRGNIRADYVRSDDNEFALYEIGKAHVKGAIDTAKLPIEYERLALVFAADSKTAARKYSQSAYYQAKKYLTTVVGNSLEFAPLESTKYPDAACYQSGRSAVITLDGIALGVIGEFTQETKKALKLPEFCAGFELDIQALTKIHKTKQYSPISIYPKIQVDITFETHESLSFAEVHKNVEDALRTTQSENGYDSTIVPGDIFQAENSDKKRMTFRIWVSHPAKTLKTTEINELFNTVAAKMLTQLNATRI